VERVEDVVFAVAVRVDFGLARLGGRLLVLALGAAGARARLFVHQRLHALARGFGYPLVVRFCSLLRVAVRLAGRVDFVAALADLLVHDPLLRPELADGVQVGFAQLPVVFRQFAVALGVGLRLGPGLSPADHVVELLLDLGLQSAMFIWWVLCMNDFLGFRGVLRGLSVWPADLLRSRSCMLGRTFSNSWPNTLDLERGILPKPASDCCKTSEKYYRIELAYFSRHIEGAASTQLVNSSTHRGRCTQLSLQTYTSSPQVRDILTEMLEERLHLLTG
jgi:hypothetical protein